MIKASHIPRNVIGLGTVLMMAGSLILLTQSSLFAADPAALSLGITVDLLITIPLIYFLLIRTTQIPNMTIFPILIGMVMIGSIILPGEHQYYLDVFKTWVLPVVELSIISFVIWNISRAIKQFRHNKSHSFDFFTTLKITCSQIFPKRLVMPVVMEISVFYYGFLNWKKKKYRDHEFSYHKESGTVPIMVVILFLIAIETFVFHLLLSRWSAVAAAMLTFLSIYSCFQIFGFMRSMFKRPISIEDNQLFLRYGIMAETTINIHDIEQVELSSMDLDKDEKTRKMTILGDLEGHNVIIHLKKDHDWLGLYGIKRTYRKLALHIDDSRTFAERINNFLQHGNDALS